MSQYMQEDCYQRTFLFNDLVSIRLPEGFKVINKKQEMQRYPFKKRPDDIRIDEVNGICVTFQLYKQLLDHHQANAAAVSMAKLIRKVYPYDQRFRIRDFHTDQNISGSGFTFYYLQKKEKQYVEFFVLPIYGRLFVGTVGCSKEVWFRQLSSIMNIKTMIEEVNSRMKRDWEEGKI